VLIDIGTGDGLFVYHQAKQNSGKLCIGLDPNAKSLEKISTKIYRNPKKGGAPNALYLQASAENLPEELNGIANEVHVLFPWGSLLAGVVNGAPQVLEHIKKICAPDANLRIMVALESRTDQSEIERLALPELTKEYVESVLIPHYKSVGFHQIQTKWIAFSELDTLPTTWAKRLQHNKDRSVLLLTATAP
jgi:16S rRNA (adenine(1408)-N(1))-methyltransferase